MLRKLRTLAHVHIIPLILRLDNFCKDPVVNNLVFIIHIVFCDYLVLSFWYKASINNKYINEQKYPVTKSYFALYL